MMAGFNFGYLHQVYASSPSLAALARVVCSPSPLPRYTRQRGCSRYSSASPPAELRGRGSYSAVGLRPRLRVRPPTYGPSTRRRPLACGPPGAVPPHGLALLIGIEVWYVWMARISSDGEAAETDDDIWDRSTQAFCRSCISCRSRL